MSRRYFLSTAGLRRRAATLVLLLLPVTVCASELDASVALFTEYQSNVVGSPDEPRSAMVNRGRFEVSGEQASERQAWSLDGDFNAQHYQHDLFDTRFDAEAVGNYRWFAVPDVIDWHLDYVESVQVIDPAAADVPTNTESVRLFGTGPDIRLQLLGHNELRMSARRQRIRNDREHYYRGSASAGVWRTIRPRHQVFARTEWSQTDYVEAAPDYRNRNYLAGYTYLSSRAQLTVEGGKGYIKEENDERQDSDIGAVRLNWQMPGSRSLSASGQQEFGDEAGDLLNYASGNLVSTIEGANPFRDRSGMLTYSGSDLLLDPLIAVWGRERRYLRANTLSRDSDERGVRVLTRLFNGDRGFVSLSGSYVQRLFIEDQRRDHDTQVVVAGTRLLTDRFDITLGSSWFERRSTDTSVEYDNATVYLELRKDL